MNLTARTETRRVEALRSLDPERQAQLGQFFTPERAAALVASIPRLPESGTLRVLDPGAGVGSLTAALVERAAIEAPSLALHVVAVEMDTAVVPYLRATLTDCESANVTTQLVEGDYIFGSTGGLGQIEALASDFDLTIMNPPYGKLGAASTYRRALQADGVDCPNMYAAFMALGYLHLADGGQLVAIVPRSFANGTYFEAFRKHMLAAVTLDRIHTFESRSTVFADTGVLQENVIVGATRRGPRGWVSLTASRGHEDDVVARRVRAEEVVNPSDPHRFIRISLDEAVSPPSASASLASLGLSASTGRVVDFRARDWLVDADAPGSVPLIYPGNIRGGEVQWPREIRKAQGLLAVDESAKKLLLPAGCYVVIKRFSAKEERRRVVAAVWRSDQPVAFENHLNVIHQNGTGLAAELAVGLSLWLNSTVIDRLFRTFSGHTQVNATDLRTLPFPPVEALRALGAGQGERLPDQDEIDRMVERALAAVEVAA